MAGTEPSARTTREIASHLSSARQAFVARDYEATLLACEKALLLDPHNGEALDLFDLVRSTVAEERIGSWLAQAGQSLDRGDVEAASDLIDQALALDPHLEAALALRKRMLALRRERERGRERARVATGPVERARARLNEQDFESAIRHADDALSLDPQSTEAQEIRAKAFASLDERRRSREPRAASTAGRPAPATRQFWSVQRIVAAAAAGLILVVAIWFWIYQLGSRSTSPAQSSSPPPSVSSVPVEQPAAAEVSPRPATDGGLREQRLTGLRQDARDQFQRGQRTALDTVTSGLKIAPEDSDLRAILDAILAEAQRLTGRAKDAAVSAGAAKYTKTYHEALKLERAAGQQITAGRKDEAIRILWKAEETFDRAERDARFELAQLKQQEVLAAAPAGGKTGAVSAPSTSAPTPPATKPTPPPPDSQPSAADLEKQRVAGIVYRYASGYSALNAAAVSAVFPGEAVWQFSEFESYTLKVEDLAIELSPDGSAATVVCTASHAFKRKSAPAPGNERLRQTFSLRKRGAGWFIASIAYDRAK